MVLLRTYDNYLTANMVLSRLNEAGFHAFLEDENASIALMPMAFNGIKLVVPDTEGPGASALLRLMDEEAKENM